MMNRKAMDMSWTMIGWMILALIVLIVLFFILKSVSTPGMNLLGELGDKFG